MSESTRYGETAQIIDYAGQLIQQNLKVHFDPEQEFILATEEKIRLCLARHLSRVEKKTAWTTPLGIFLAILVVFPTTNFADWGFSAATWEAVFLISGALSFIWLIRAVLQARVSTSIDDVIADLKSIAQENAAPQQRKTEKLVQRWREIWDRIK